MGIKAIGMIMVEHRLIERVVALLKRELEAEEGKHTANPAFIYGAVDFFRTYADRTHHGKEEDILFAELAKKDLSPEHRKTMDELVREHKIARESVAALNEAAKRYERGDLGAIAQISEKLKSLIALYPQHIHKEDHDFFLPAMQYFSDEEQEEMLQRCIEFDRKMIHEKYAKMVDSWE